MPGRAGWELRLVVQGGLRILDKVERRRLPSARTGARPSSAPDLPVLAWRALLDARAPRQRSASESA